MVDKCCKQADVETCFGEEVFPISFNKNETKMYTGNWELPRKPDTTKVVLQTAMVASPCALTINLPADHNIYLDCIDYSHRL